MGVTVFAVLLSLTSNLTNQITTSAKLNHSISIGPNVANDIWSIEEDNSIYSIRSVHAIIE